MAYNKHMMNGNIQVYRPISKQDKTVHKALEITRTFKVLPYPEVEKKLDEIVNYSLIDKKYAKVKS